MLRAPLFRSKAFLTAYFLLINVLFFLPGTRFPKEDWLDRIFFDKWVHIGLFGALLFLGCSAFMPPWRMAKWILLLAVVYGTLIEVLQQLLVAHRSFDVYDIMADAVGAAAGLLVWRGVYKKNKPL